MKISFFEEFPEKGLEKAKLINFPSTLYIATKSLIEFKYFRDKLKKINVHIYNIEISNQMYTYRNV